ncbi:uncharacterized protein ASCRUDRAFT_79487 [Ascoidea rubescens DSM 1968]|uniref:NUDE domain-containing protein n=1 Tax=Ascoidea rubescens DSM 1968 TaxID=1344418 RepID=A0A1D2VML9_9ASCO|nr:hypothetical protein ASCRUDRAFT_79487 [Ascoidea rubescens DSM 1968]ODV62856.1 hypothetical protein ASCRUDRAFT_79487 [Ascoidea rubescens DSM 1968]
MIFSKKIDHLSNNEIDVSMISSPMALPPNLPLSLLTESLNKNSINDAADDTINNKNKKFTDKTSNSNNDDITLNDDDIYNDIENDLDSCEDDIISHKRYKEALNQINQLENELSEFQSSSYELEQELEKELNDLDSKNESLKLNLIESEKETSLWKNKFFNLQKDLQNQSVKAQEQISNYKNELSNTRNKLINIEIINDNIEQNERKLNVNLNELDSKYNDTLEQVALLESELDYKNELLLKEQLEHQNTRNSLLEVQKELDNLKNSINKSTSASTTSTGLPLIFNSIGIFGNTNNNLSRTPSNSLDSTSQRSFPKSNSIRQLHDMINQAKGMESRVENIKISLKPKHKLRKSNKSTDFSSRPHIPYELKNTMYSNNNVTFNYNNYNNNSNNNNNNNNSNYLKSISSNNGSFTDDDEASFNNSLDFRLNNYQSQNFHTLFSAQTNESNDSVASSLDHLKVIKRNNNFTFSYNNSNNNNNNNNDGDFNNTENSKIENNKIENNKNDIDKKNKTIAIAKIVAH